MGLYCYMRRTAKSPKEVVFPSDLHLYGREGSFRGKVYTEFFLSNLRIDLYNDLFADQMPKVAQALANLLKEHPGQAWDDESGWFPDGTRKERYYTVRAQEVADLAALFQAAADQYCEMAAWY